MANLRWRGDSLKVAQVVTITPANVAAGNTFTLTINGKSITYTADASAAGTPGAAVADVTGGLVAAIANAISAGTIPEFAEVTAVDNGINLTLTAATPGTPFTVTTSAAGGTATLTVAGALATPVNAAFTDLPTGGTLAFNTAFFYRVSALNTLGETLASTETSITTANDGNNTHRVTVAWGAVTGATGYRIYGRTTGAELLIATVGNVTSFIDTGSVTPAGALPTINSTGFTTLSSGPNDWSVASNWDSGTVPGNNDTVFVEGPVDILYGLNQPGLTLTALNILSTFTGKLGLQAYNGKYWEYRTTELTIGATTITVGEGPGQVSNHLRLNTGTVQTTLVVKNTATNPFEANTQALRWRGTHTSNVVEVLRGLVGIAKAPGQAAAVATLNVGYLNNVGGDATVQVGSGITQLTTVNQFGGNLMIDATTATITTILQTNGSSTILSTGTITTVTVDGGTLNYNAGSGTIATLNVGNAGTFARQNPLSVTVTNTNVYKGATVLDPFATVTWTSGIAMKRCRMTEATVDLGENRTMLSFG